MSKYGILSLFLKKFPEKNLFVHKKKYERQVDIFHQEAFEDVKRDGSKLRTYALVKSQKGFETYLMEIKNISVRKAVTKFRLSNHQLMIEKGRHKQISKEKRFCPFCPDVAEDEFHFVFFCPLYTHLRTFCLDPVCNDIYNYKYLPQKLKFQILISELSPKTCEFIAKGFELSKFLMSKPKRLS